VKNVHTKIVTPEGGAATFTIGIAAGGSEFEGNGDAKCRGRDKNKRNWRYRCGVTAGGQKYTSDGYLYFDASADLDATVIDVTAEVVDIDS